MKRLFVMLLSFALLLSICACGNEGKDSDKGVIGRWDRDFSIVDYEPYDDIHSGWVFGKLTEKHGDGKMYGYAYCLLYGGDVKHSSYNYNMYCVNDDNTITIINYYYKLVGGWDIDVYYTLKIETINGKLALIDTENENRVYYYSGNGNDVLGLYEE